MKVVFVASGVILAVLGIVGIVVGAILPNIVEDQITQGMKENLPRDVEDEEVVCPGSCEPSTKPNDIYVFNITNAKDVLENSETKPIVTQHKFSFTVHQTDYAMDYDAKTDSIGKRTLTRYVAKNEADYDTKFITINPVYVGAVAGQTGSEQGLLLGLVVPTVLSTLYGSVGQLANAVAILSVGSYFRAVLGFCLTNPATQEQDLSRYPGCIAAFNGNQTKFDDEYQGGIIALMGGAKLAAVNANAKYGANIDPSVDGFSLGTNVSASFLTLLVSENPGVGLQSTDACALYLQAATAAAASDLTTVGNFFTAAKAIVPALTFAEYTTVLTYFGKIVTDPTFKLEVLAAVAIGGDYSALTSDTPGLRWKEAVNTWDDLIFSQIGSGTVLGDKSLGLFAGQPPFEFFASQSPAALADRVTITGVQAKLLFSDVSSIPGVVPGFCGELAKVQTGVITPTDFITKYTKYGVTGQSLQAMGNYLCVYLSTEFFAKPVLAGGVLKADGTNAINGGLFVEKTLREIMHGFDDPLYSALKQPQSYKGLLTQGEDNVTAAEAKDKADGNEGVKDRVVAGTKDNLDKIGYWVEAQGLKFIEKITDFKDGTCPNPAVYTSGFAFDCKLWDEKEQIEGVADTRWPPLNEDTPVEDFEFYVHDLKRSVKVEQDEEVELHKIRMVRYRILDSEDKRPEDVEGDEAKARANKYLPPMSGFIDLQRAQGMVPILIGFPRHSKASEAEAGKIVGLAKEHWEETEDDLTTYFDVEPLTGVMMGAHKRLQYNLLLKKSNFNAFPFYKNVTDDKMAFPILWLDDYNFISEEDAALVNEAIFDVRTQMKTVSLVAIIISVVNCVAGAALVLIGMKSDAAGELSNRS